MCRHRRSDHGCLKRAARRWINLHKQMRPSVGGSVLWGQRNRMAWMQLAAQQSLHNGVLAANWGGVSERWWLSEVVEGLWWR